MFSHLGSILLQDGGSIPLRTRESASFTRKTLLPSSGGTYFLRPKDLTSFERRTLLPSPDLTKNKPARTISIAGRVWFLSSPKII